MHAPALPGEDLMARWWKQWGFVAAVNWHWWAVGIGINWGNWVRYGYIIVGPVYVALTFMTEAYLNHREEEARKLAEELEKKVKSQQSFGTIKLEH